MHLWPCMFLCVGLCSFNIDAHWWYDGISELFFSSRSVSLHFLMHIFCGATKPNRLFRISPHWSPSEPEMTWPVSSRVLTGERIHKAKKSLVRLVFVIGARE